MTIQSPSLLDFLYQPFNSKGQKVIKKKKCELFYIYLFAFDPMADTKIYSTISIHVNLH